MSLYVNPWQQHLFIISHLCEFVIFFFFFMLPTLCPPSEELTSGWRGNVHSRLVSNWFQYWVLKDVVRRGTICPLHIHVGEFM